VQQTRFERCSRCGASYFEKAPRMGDRRRRGLQWGAGLLALVALVVAVVLVEGARRDREARERADRTKAIVAERARLTHIQAPHRGTAVDLRPASGATAAERLAARAALVEAVQRSITRDARARERAGELDGPISGTECGPLTRSKEAVPDDRDLAKAIGRYDCVAVKSDVKGITGRSVGRLGHPFVAALDFDRFTYTWCRNTPAQGEGGQALVFVRLDRACLAATGKALGTGYVDVPGA